MPSPAARLAQQVDAAIESAFEWVDMDFNELLAQNEVFWTTNYVDTKDRRNLKVLARCTPNDTIVRVYDDPEKAFKDYGFSELGVSKRRLVFLQIENEALGRFNLTHKRVAVRSHFTQSVARRLVRNGQSLGISSANRKTLAVRHAPMVEGLFSACPCGLSVFGVALASIHAADSALSKRGSKVADLDEVTAINTALLVLLGTCTTVAWRNTIPLFVSVSAGSMQSLRNDSAVGEPLATVVTKSERLSMPTECYNALVEVSADTRRCCGVEPHKRETQDLTWRQLRGLQITVVPQTLTLSDDTILRCTFEPHHAVVSHPETGVDLFQMAYQPSPAQLLNFRGGACTSDRRSSEKELVVSTARLLMGCYGAPCIVLMCGLAVGFWFAANAAAPDIDQRLFRWSRLDYAVLLIAACAAGCWGVANQERIRRHVQHDLVTLLWLSRHPFNDANILRDQFLLSQ